MTNFETRKGNCDINLTKNKAFRSYVVKTFRRDFKFENDVVARVFWIADRLMLG